jgi:hypothetical protein
MKTHQVVVLQLLSSFFSFTNVSFLLQFQLSCTLSSRQLHWPTIFNEAYHIPAHFSKSNLSIVHILQGKFLLYFPVAAVLSQPVMSMECKLLRNMALLRVLF